MQSGQLRIFDIIVAVNDKNITLTGKSAQKTLDDLLLPKTDFKLDIYRPEYSLSNTCKVLSVGKLPFQYLVYPITQ